MNEPLLSVFAACRMPLLEMPVPCVVWVWRSRAKKKKPAGAVVYILYKSAVLCVNFKLIFFFCSTTFFFFKRTGQQSRHIRVPRLENEGVGTSNDELLLKGSNPQVLNGSRSIVVHPNISRGHSRGLEDVRILRIDHAIVY